jgi:hypothetical protein
MKKIITFIVVLTGVQISNAQAFDGKGDFKFQVGGNFQHHGSGITATMDFGLAENFSYGFYATYLLNTKDFYDQSADFVDRADIKVRINANIGNVLNIGDHIDIYPGLNLGTRNFGAHTGFRYFFSDGFGLFSEASVPLARYDNDVVGFDKLNNQFVLTLGAVFNF